MSEPFRCGDEGALVAYLYEECEPAERRAVAAHLTSCAVCAEQVSQWSWTREQVRTWTPPEAALGFQITARHAALTPRLVDEAPRPAVAWWRAPLPAWAQAAAAVLVFGAGLSVGLARDAGSVPAPEAAPATASASPAEPGVSPAELAALEARLLAELRERAPVQGGPVVATALANQVEAGLMRQVREMVDQSAVEQRIDFTERQVDFERALETRRRTDRDQLLQVQNAATQEIREHAEAINSFSNYLQRVSQPGQPGR
jgi:hypothetical protein